MGIFYSVLLFFLSAAAVFFSGPGMESLAAGNLYLFALAGLVSFLLSLALVRNNRQLYLPSSKYDLGAPFIKAGVVMAVAFSLLIIVFHLPTVAIPDAAMFVLFYSVFSSVFSCIRLVSKSTGTSGDNPGYVTEKKVSQLNLTGMTDRNPGVQINTGSCIPLEFTSLQPLVDEAIQKCLQFNPLNPATPCLAVVGETAEEMEAATAGRKDILILRERLENLRNINSVVMKLGEALKPGGFLVCSYVGLDQKEKNLRSRFSSFSYYLVKPFNYLFFRAFPKIPLTRPFYFFLTGGKNQHVSTTEIWGRLNYCGFEVVNEKEQGGIKVLVASKQKTASEEKNPSYYPIVRLNRVSIDGRVIRIFKLRSMYPYSEFLQKRIFEENQLASSGKIHKDYRITYLGRIYRKYWLDELPQLLNWLRGDIKLVGIRALSLHYFSLYPEEYRDLFIKVKPGLVPPLFDEKTADFSEIVRVESEYLHRYLEHPFRTDLKYFWLTFRHIFVRGVRSA